MPKPLTRLSLALLTVSLCACAAVAQTTLEWIILSPAREEFTARMPNQSAPAEQSLRVGDISFAGTRYAASDEGSATYVVWSLQNPDGVLWRKLSAAEAPSEGRNADSLYLDQVAELAWELLVTPELARIKREEAEGEARRIAEAGVGMTYVRGFAIGGKQAREYNVRLQKEGGYVYVCADDARVYVVAAHGPSAGAERLRQFVESFAFKGAVPASDTGTGIGTGSGTGTGIGTVNGGGGPANTGRGDGPVDYNRPFKQSDVTKKARITFKPEPSFTESARKFNVTGVVRLRAILSKTGEMMNISVVKSLPHGLTEKSINAARQIRFEPAQKDGQPVSQYVVLEYNYNIY